MSDETSTTQRTLMLTFIAFTLGFLTIALGYGQGHFLLSAWHHAGF